MPNHLVIEFHYDDGDVGAHPSSRLEYALWKQFSGSASHAPSHIVIRPESSAGQALSDSLFSAAHEHHEVQSPEG